MSVFGKFIAKMDENDLASALAQSERSMLPAARRALVESIFAVFRERGESSEDAAEGAGTTVSAIEAGQSQAVAALLAYAHGSAGLLKEATTTFIEEHPEFVDQLPPALVRGISR
ncbi:MAG TPA: hypothetical protein VIG51_08545 [Candidatus Baltobacteraceae bacterium]|jgi:hypothetical protein